MALHSRLATALIALAAALPLAATAQNTAAAPVPAAVAPSYGHADDSIKGRIASFDGGYNLQVRDDRGFVDNVQLHPGTVINPTGIRLAPGMAVTIYGVNRGAFFAAGEIDTPYDSYGAIPVYPYGPYAYPVYPYAVYPYPEFSFGLHFGGGFHHHFR